MEGGSSLAEFLFSITLFYNFGSCQEMFVSNYFKTTVILENVNVPMAPMFTDPVINNHECSQLCTRDYGCRKYMVTTDITTHDKLCYRYSDGENCVASLSELSNKQSVCYRKFKQSNGIHCVSPVGYHGINCADVIKDCYDGQNYDFRGISLSYVKPADKIIEVLCDFDNGMTNIQVRRSDSVEVNFTRTWDEYVNGFGYTHSEYWLGLQNIYDLTHGTNYKLDIYLNGPAFTCGMLCPDFELKETTFYSFSTACIFGCPDDSYTFIDAVFSTYDQNRHYDTSNCQIPFHAGWWFKDVTTHMLCIFPNLNSPRGMLYWKNNEVTSVIMRIIP